MMNNIFKRKHGDVHPEIIFEFIPNKEFKPKYNESDDIYDGLTNESKFMEYAWAFLRRNRFYQNSIDKSIQEFADISFWGFKSSEGTPKSCGLSEKKGYWEQYEQDRKECSWEGITSFFKDHSAIRRPLTPPNPCKELSEVQVPFVFDIDCLLGPNTSAIEIQIQIAKSILIERAKNINSKTEHKAKPPKQETKIELRNMLRVADILSPQICSTTGAATWEIGTKKPSFKEIVPKLPESALGRSLDKNKDVSELVEKAYTMIYEWGFLKLLQWDDWFIHLSEPSSNRENIQAT